MIRSEKIETIRKILGPTSPVVVKGFLESDHKPHVFEVNDKNKLGGEVNDTDLKGVRCKNKNCNLKFEEHTFKLKLMLSINRDTKNEEVAEALRILEKFILNNEIDSVAFVESEKGYKFI